MISDVSIPNGEDDSNTYLQRKSDSHVNMEPGLPRKGDDELMH